MSSPYALAPEYASQPSFTVPSNRMLIKGMNALLKLQRRKFKWSEGVDVKTHEISSAEGHTIPLFEIAPKGLSGSAAAVLDYHGGGFFFSYAALHLSCAERYAMECGCRVFLPTYRLSADHPFPAGFDDCYAALSWVHANASTLGVDPQRVAVLGDSAGGALAAGVAQKALDLNENPICAQILIYPVTDHETKTESARAFTDTPMWKTASNLTLWKLYLRGSEHLKSGGTAPVPQYAAPLHRTSFAGLPPALVEVAEFDPLRDEGRLYCEALEAAGVATEFREVKGGIHGYDLVEGSPTSAAVFKERIVSLQRLLG